MHNGSRDIALPGESPIRSGWFNPHTEGSWSSRCGRLRWRSSPKGLLVKYAISVSRLGRAVRQKRGWQWRSLDSYGCHFCQYARPTEFSSIPSL